MSYKETSHFYKITELCFELYFFLLGSTHRELVRGNTINRIIICVKENKEIWKLSGSALTRNHFVTISLMESGS